ncbi:hypothetical protein [Rhizobium sp.]
MDLRSILLVAWAIPLGAAGALLYHEYMMPSAAGPETNRAMRTRMCLQHADLARAEPENAIARVAVEECVGSGYITHAEGIKAID